MRKGLGVLMLIGGLALGACGGGAASTPHGAATEASSPVGAVGTPATFGTLSVTVNAVTTPAPGATDTPRAGYHAVTLDVSLADTGTTPLDPDNDLRFAITDATGRAFPEDDLMPTTQPAFQPIAPHGIGRGGVGFQVANDAHGLTLVVRIWPHSNGAANLANPTALAQALATAAASGPDGSIGMIRVALGN